MPDRTLIVTDHDRVRVLTFNRPEVRNAFDTAQYSATAAELRDAAEDPAVSVVVLTGTGTAFSAGQDLAEMGRIADDTGGPEGAAAAGGFPAFLDALVEFPKPLLAAVNGVGVGVGLTLLFHCDIVIIADDARFRAPFAPLGVVPEAAASLLAPLRLGWAAATYVLLTGEWVDAAFLERHGLAWKVCPATQVLPEALEIAATLARLPLASLVETKALTTAPGRDAVRHAAEREYEAFQRLLGGPANQEALAAFLEGRAPDFSKLGPG